MPTGSKALEHAPKLDPIVGGVSEIGRARFAYMRMQCGADPLKPDPPGRQLPANWGSTCEPGRHMPIKGQFPRVVDISVITDRHPAHRGSIRSSIRWCWQVQIARALDEIGELSEL